MFVRRIKRFTERQGEGFAMVALAKRGCGGRPCGVYARGDRRRPVYRFSRNATLPDGEEREIGVALAYTDFSPAAGRTFFACQHLAKDVLFQPAYLDHPNGATGVSSCGGGGGDPGGVPADCLAAPPAKFSALDAGVESRPTGRAQRIWSPDTGGIPHPLRTRSAQSPAWHAPRRH